jgi:hypothetical protein
MSIIIAQLMNSFTTCSLFSTSELTEVRIKTDQVSLRKKKGRSWRSNAHDRSDVSEPSQLGIFRRDNQLNTLNNAAHNETGRTTYPHLFQKLPYRDKK